MQNKNLKRAILSLCFLLLLAAPVIALGVGFSISSIQSVFADILNAIKSKLDSIASIIPNLFLAGLSDAPGQPAPTATPDFTIRAPEGGVPRWWDDGSFHQQEVGFVQPIVQEGLVRITHYTGEGIGKVSDQITNGGPAIVSGAVTFNMDAYGGWSGFVGSLEELRYRYILHTPGGAGSGIRTPLSDVLVGQQTTTWDSTSIPDGTYAVSVELVGGGADADTAIDRFESIPLTIVVDNTPGVVMGEQWLPLIGYMGMRSRWAESFAVDWVRSTETPLSPAAVLYPYEFVTPPQTDAERQALVGLGKFAAETWLQVWNARFDPEGRLSQTKEGHRVIVGYFENVATEKTWPLRFPFTDGQRNQASLNKQTAFRPDPTGPGFIGISYEGRLFRIHPIGGITTLAGRVSRSEAVPYTPWDTAVTFDEFEANQWHIVGDFGSDPVFTPGNSKSGPMDLVIDLENPNIIYIADTGDHVIRKVDLGGQEAQVTIFAGQLGVSGSTDGTGTAARFNKPFSIEIVGRTLYVADYNNNALRAINLETKEVTTVLDSSQITKPHWIRRFSNGDLALEEGGRIISVKPDSGTILRTIANNTAGGGHTFDVDWRGLIGPVDDLLVYGRFRWVDDHFERYETHAVSRLSLATGTAFIFSKDWGLVEYTSGEGLAGAGDSGAYAISTAIDDEEPRVIQTGQYQWGVHVLRPVRPDDPTQSDIKKALSNRGRDHYMAGTIREFYPNNDRPSLAALHGRKGHNYIGQLNFDDMMSWTDAQLAQYIRDGMNGGVARPELTGRDLAAMIYFIRLHSLQGKTQVIDKNQIAYNLNAAGFWDNIADATVPVISGVRVSRIDETSRNVTFTTDEPTVAAIRYGRTSNYGLTSSISDQYRTTHTIAIKDLDPLYADEVHFQIRVKDQAGNQQITANALLGGGEPNNPPVVNAGSDQTIILPSNQVTLQGAATDDGLPNPPGAITTTWSKASGPGTVTFANLTALNTTATFSGVGLYTLTLSATDSVLISSDSVAITVRAQGSGDLNVSLSADPNSGQAPLNNVDLTANITGTAQGNINYTFYCNRADSGVNITTPYDARYDNIPETTKTAEGICNYEEQGVYTAKVIAQRGTLSAEARRTINVSDPPPPPENCQDADQDNINDYNPAVCPSGRDLCIQNKLSLTRPETDQYQPASNIYELLYDRDQDDIRDILNFRIRLQDKALIEFRDRLDLIHLRDDGCFERINMDQAITIDANKAEINTTLYPELNKPAQITFYNVTLNDPVIKKDGAICQEPACRILNYDRTNHILIIEVSGFSKYAIVSLKSYLTQKIMSYLIIIASLLAAMVSGVHVVLSKRTE